MTGKLTGKVALITGAASGMGAAEATLFIEEGARVVLSDLQDDAGSALAGQLGPNAAFVRHNVTSAEDWNRAVAFAEEKFGKLDILVNNAGLFKPGTLEETSDELFDSHVMVNQRGVFLGMKTAVPAMKRAGRGSIVNISSGAGLRGGSGLFAYAMTKWAVRGMTKCAALELAADSIRVNSVHPGPIRTPMMDDWPDEWHERVAASVPLQRVGSPDEVARLVAFLASDESAYITGSEVAIDGGGAA